MKILIIADGNNKIGMGHIYRCTSLSKELKKHGHKVRFITKDKIAKSFFSKISNCLLTKSLTSSKTNFFIKEFSPELILIDKLKETKSSLKNLKKFSPILAIDYVGKNEELISYGINILYHKTGIQKKSFSDINYAILNKTFTRSTKIKIKKDVKSILILQGGSDTYCFTPKILKSILKSELDLSISIVLGPSFQCWKELNQFTNNNKKTIKIFHDVKNMSLLMKKHDISITAGGNTLTELAYMGIPSLIICGEKFELETAKIFEKNGFGINLGFGGSVSESIIQQNFEQIVENYPLRKKMNSIGPKLVTGNGIVKIIKIIESLKLK